MKQSLQDTRKNLSTLINDLVETGPVEITRHGKVVAVLTLPGVMLPVSKPIADLTQTVSFDHDVRYVGEKQVVSTRPKTDKEKQAERDALLNAMNKKVKG